jgi:hypothetical protein
VHVTDQEAGAPTVVGVDVGSEVLSTVCGLLDVVVQSPGSVRVNAVSVFVGPYPPLLWTTAWLVTLNAVPAVAEAGLETETLLTFTSDAASTFVFELLEALLLPVFPSLTCNWSTVVAAATEKLCAEGLVQVTDHEAGAPGTVVGVETGSEVLFTTTGLVEPVVQSPGSVRVSVELTFVGP